MFSGTAWNTRPRGFRISSGRNVPSGGEIVFALLVTGAIVTLASIGLFRVSERRAKNAGLLDQTTGS